MTWTRLAADRGVAGAQFALGEMYVEGLVLPKDEAAAVE
ncbi:MAG TPA: sel1 repeat family protein, partial [Acidobacteria bacterium]|nr:sel1 repeat family protein [Acidobacteriota bacterium]